MDEPHILAGRGACMRLLATTFALPLTALRELSDGWG